MRIMRSSRACLQPSTILGTVAVVATIAVFSAGAAAQTPVTAEHSLHLSVTELDVLTKRGRIR